MHNQLQFHVGSTSQSAARVYFSGRDSAEIVAASGKCLGPYCKYAKTLPAEFSFHLSTHPKMQQNIVETMILDPCYWSPTLPFTYEIELQLQLTSGQEIFHQGTIGMRQWHTEQGSLYLGFRRTVLRGYRSLDLCEENIQGARDLESSLLTVPAAQPNYQFADQQGVGLVVDLRNVGDSLHDQNHRLNWSPSAMVAILNAEQLSRLASSSWPQQCLLAQFLSADSKPSEIKDTHADLFALELNAEERPPQWTSRIELPMIAIRQGVSEARLQKPRHGCDALQADLAPEFNLAGYFVSR